MKKGLWAISASLFLSLSGVASADSVIHVVHCHNALPVADAGYTVMVNQLMPTHVPGHPHRSHMEATVEEVSFTGSRVIKRVPVRREQSDALGAPLYFRGQDFELEVLVDSTPANGGIRSHLNFESNGKRISEEMLCNFTR